MDKKKPKRKKPTGIESLVPIISDIITATIKLLRTTKEIKKKQPKRRVKNNGH